jgi:hypothetical protein
MADEDPDDDQDGQDDQRRDEDEQGQPRVCRPGHRPDRAHLRDPAATIS